MPWLLTAFVRLNARARDLSEFRLTLFSSTSLGLTAELIVARSIWRISVLFTLPGKPTN